MRLEIVCEDRLGIAKEILSILLEYNIDLKAIETDAERNIFLSFPQVDFSELQQVLPVLRRIPGVEDVKTVPFTPVEREQFELLTITQMGSNALITLDTKARILRCNRNASALLKQLPEDLSGQTLNHWVHGFAFSRWLESDDICAQQAEVVIHGKTFVAQLQPIFVPDVLDDQDRRILCGAVIQFGHDAPAVNQSAVNQVLHEDSFNRVFSMNSPMLDVISQAKKMAALNKPLLIQGETGTGKELLARACHNYGVRAHAPFIALNCAGLPSDVAESELFGLAESNSGDKQNQKGVLESAQGGTVFLDEIGEMSVALQAKLLRFLQDGTFRRVGEENELRVDVRVICSSQKDIAELVQSGSFREDLYYRLNVLSLMLPPLRERKSDIVPLAEHFIEQMSLEQGKPAPILSRPCKDYLMQYPWPGNVRQLENAIFRAIGMHDGAELMLNDLKLPAHTGGFSYFDENFEGTLEQAVKKFEASLLRRLYPAYPSTRQLARKLGVSHTAIANKLREYSINKKGSEG